MKSMTAVVATLSGLSLEVLLCLVVLSGFALAAYAMHVSKGKDR